MANSADPDQLASDLDLHHLQRQDRSGFSRTRVNYHQFLHNPVSKSQALNTFPAWNSSFHSSHSVAPVKALLFFNQKSNDVFPYFSAGHF